MKKAINIWSFPGEVSWEEKLQWAKSAGFAGFEVDLSEDGVVNMESTPADLAQVRESAEKAGLQLTSLATGMYWGANPVSADVAVRDRARAILEKQITSAAALGLDAILVVPGSVGADFIPGSEVVPYDLAYERATAFIKEALPLAEENKVVIGIENVWNKFLLSPLEMRAFIDQFGSEYVGAYLDVGNTLALGYPEHWIPVLGSRIRRVHFKDYRRAVGSVDGFVDLLSGDVNWPAVVSSLRSVGYEGWVAAEMIPPAPFYKYSPETLIHNTSRAMDDIFSL